MLPEAELHPAQHKFNHFLDGNVGSVERLLSAVGGGLLAWYGARKGDKAGLGLASAGGALLFRGLTGYCPVNHAIGRDSAHSGSNSEAEAVEITETIRVFQALPEVYAFWRQLENLPRFMHHLERVHQHNRRHSHWEARIPGGLGTIDWEAEITAEEEGRLLAWRSRPGADIDNAGEVRFTELPGNRGTQIDVRISYTPPAAGITVPMAKLLNPAFEKMIRDDLQRFRSVIEAGEIPYQEDNMNNRTAALSDEAWGASV